MASASTTYRSRDDMKRQRELEEARKAGLAPAEVDVETGQAINPHIPNYMTSAPWYVDPSGQPSLQHQKDWRIRQKDGEQWYSRGARGKANAKFKKGACENCGATTHKVKDCLERPRKRAAKWTHEDLAPDDVVEDVAFEGWAHKRDAYKGFTPDDYDDVVARHERLHHARQELLRSQAAATRYAQDGDTAAVDAAAAAGAAAADGAAPAAGGGGGGDEDKLADEEQAEFTKVEKRVRTAGGGASGTTRNLRIREDTAKYLLNLDPNSAHYDPKSRSMRADPRPDLAASEKTFAGDNAARESGDFEYWRQLTTHAVMEGEAGKSTHVQAAPTQALLAHAAFREKKARLAAKSREAVLAKYGNAAPAAADTDLLLPTSEAYVEYDRTGKVVKGQEVRVRSRYVEDVHPQNHTSVWGSYWVDGRWGYACCRSLMRNSLCVGSAGGEARRAAAAAAAAAAQTAAPAEERRGDGGGGGGSGDAAAAPAAAPGEEARASAPGDRGAGGDVGRPPAALSATWGAEAAEEDGTELDEAKVQAALARLRAEEAGAAQGGAGEGVAGYNAAGGRDGDAGVTAEEMEAYRRHRGRASDPMEAMKAGQGTDGYAMV